MEHKKIEALSNRLPGQYKSLAKFSSHCFSAIDEAMDYHRRLVAMNAIAGIKPDASEEKAYLSTISELKCLILAELEKTPEEIEHFGDKHWNPHYSDGLN